MGLKVILWDPRPRADGTCVIKIYLNRDKKKYYILGEYYCLPKDFDYKKGRVKDNRANANHINAHIIIAYNRFEQLMLEHPSAGVDDIVEMFEGKKNSKETFTSFMDTFVSDCKSGKLMRDKKTVKGYVTSINHIKAFAPKMDFNDINKTFYDTFTNHLRNLKDKDGVKYALHENTIGRTIKHIKVFMNEANERGVTTIIEHKKKYFKTINVETDSIYLNEKEIDKIINLDLSQRPALQSERDRFIVAYYFLFRYSDSIRIDKSMIFSDNGREFIRMRAQKTNNEVIVPIKPVVKNILERNNYVFSSDTNQEANWKIKEICRLAGIDEVVHLDGVSAPKHSFVASHTARRSGATNLYLAKVSTKIIMDLGGWKSMQVFLKYIRASKIETATLMSNHPHYV